MTGRPDPKPTRVRGKLAPIGDRECQVCLHPGPGLERAHLLGGSWKEDVEDLIAVLCGGLGRCKVHSRYHNADPVAEQEIREALTPKQVDAIVVRVGWEGLRRRYRLPGETSAAGAARRLAGETGGEPLPTEGVEQSVSPGDAASGEALVTPAPSPELAVSTSSLRSPVYPADPVGIDVDCNAFPERAESPRGESQDRGAVGMRSDEEPAPRGPRSESARTLPERGTPASASEQVDSATKNSEAAVPVGASGAGTPSTPPSASEHSDDELEPCTTCRGTGKRKKRQAKPRPKRTLSIAVPADTENGLEILRAFFEAGREELREPLGYDETTPIYYVISAVFADWLNSRTERKAA